MDYASAAKELSSKGRNGDSMLVHMTPEEVGGLQNLAMAAGGSLSINPDTGLVEASFLKKLLPTLLGVGLNFLLPGSGALIGALGGKAAAAGLITGLGTTAVTGDINKGLMAGLGAFGGASLGGALAGKGAAAAALPDPTTSMSAIPGATGAAGATGTAAQTASKLGLQGFAAKSPAALLSGGAPTGGMSVIPAAGGAAAKTGLAGFGQQFGQAARGTMTGLAAKAAPYAAGYGLLSNLSEASTPQFKPPGEEDKWNYEGPYIPQPRQARFQSPEEARRSGGAEFQFFDETNPVPGYVPMPRMAEGGLAALPAAGDLQASMDFFRRNSPGPITASMRPVERPAPQVQTGGSSAPAAMPAPAPGQGEQVFNFNRPVTPAAPPLGMPQFNSVPFFGGGRGINDIFDSVVQPYAKGGEVDMKDGSFVVDARTVSELGNGSSNAGIERLAGMGGRPVRGDGDGVSDSVPARIGGRQEARVARDEVIFSPEAVTRLGGGSHSKGTKKLYAMMDKAHAARKRAKRGQDTKVAKGLGALA
jgi:hypothetical protein